MQITFIEKQNTINLNPSQNSSTSLPSSPGYTPKVVAPPVPKQQPKQMPAPKKDVAPKTQKQIVKPK